MILLKLNPYSFHSNAEYPLRTRSKSLRVAIRIALEIWALMLIVIYPLIFYLIYIFSHVFSYTNNPISRDLSRSRYVSLQIALVYLLIIICSSVAKLLPYVEGWVKSIRTLAQRLTIVDTESALIYDARAPILYLRSFLDRYTGNDVWSQPESDENLIFPIIRELGPVIAIGQPCETLPPLGATRLYLENDCNWQTTVIDYFSHSRLIVISPSYSAGIIWEASKAFQLCPPEKVIISLISFKPELDYSKNHDDYKLFRDAIKINTKIELPEDIDESFFIYFDSDWKPKLAKSDANRFNSWFIEAAVRDALHKLLQSNGIHVNREMPLGWHISNIYKLIIVCVAYLIPIMAVIRAFLE